MGTPQTRPLRLYFVAWIIALVAIGCDDAGGPGGEPADAAVADGATETPDGATPDAADPDAFVPDPDAFVPDPDAFVPDPDAFVPDPDAFVPDPDAFVPDPDGFVPDPDAFVPDAEPDAEPDADPDMAQPDMAPPCPAGQLDCPCGLNDFCELGLACVDGTCAAPCVAGAEGCPCDRGDCDDGLACREDVCGPCDADTPGCPCDAGECGEDLVCDEFQDTCRPAEVCAEIECLDHQLCREPELAGEVPECLRECEDGWVWSPLDESCVEDAVPPTCQELDCAGEGRVCDDGDLPRCGDCIEGLIDDGGCREPLDCFDQDCAVQQRECIEAAGADAVCGACIIGFAENNGRCEALPDCDALDCGAQNRACDDGPPAACGACVDGYLEEGGACVVDANGCVALDCGAQNRVCVAGDPAVCGACRVGYEERDGACVIPPRPNCQPDAEASILADCQGLGRVCEATAEGAECGVCNVELVEDPNTGECVPPVVCEDLNCDALGRTCSGGPFAACGDCVAGTQPADPEDPESACLPPLTCNDIECPDDEFCLEGSRAFGQADPVVTDAGLGVGLRGGQQGRQEEHAHHLKAPSSGGCQG